jgi:hypothetical protein
MVLFPQPDAPTNAMVWPGFTSRFSPLNTGTLGLLGYRKWTPLKVTRPWIFWKFSYLIQTNSWAQYNFLNEYYISWNSDLETYYKIMYQWNNFNNDMEIDVPYCKPHYSYLKKKINIILSHDSSLGRKRTYVPVFWILLTSPPSAGFYIVHELPSLCHWPDKCPKRSHELGNQFKWSSLWAGSNIWHSCMVKQCMTWGSKLVQCRWQW